jgi:precorrin-2/cobalt-factor-2 C20-methyltransferase
MSNVYNEISGKLYGIGLGPGDPSLLTLKAKEILNKVKTIFVPLSKKTNSSSARLIVEAVLDKPKEIVELIFPMTKDKTYLLRHWEAAAFEIAKKIEKEGEAAFVTIGDPFIYSTYIYLLKTLKRCFPCIKSETIPGISSINAASARVEVPLLKGDERLAVIPVSGNLDKLGKALEEFDTVILMKIGANLNKVIKFLEELNLLKNSILISRLGSPQEQIIEDLSTLKDDRLGYFSIIIVKKEGLGR